jgi:putative membrane protein
VEVAMRFKIILSVILASLALLFIVQNFAVIDIRFLFWTVAISRSLLMFSLFLIGLILGDGQCIAISFIAGKSEKLMK